MISKELTIRNDSGFHIRPAQLFTEKAASFQSTVNLEYINEPNTVIIDGKSILGLMTLGLEKGSVITLTTQGPDEQAAMDALVELVESGFGEV